MNNCFNLLVEKGDVATENRTPKRLNTRALILGFCDFAQLRELTIRFVTCVRPCTRQHIGSRWTDFRDILYRPVLLKRQTG
jgi:hypothetical protein